MQKHPGLDIEDSNFVYKECGCIWKVCVVPAHSVYIMYYSILYAKSFVEFLVASMG